MDDDSKRPDLAFTSLVDARALPVPPSSIGRPWEYPHADPELSRFKVRVHPPDANGRVLRQWCIRAKYQLTVGGKVLKKEDRKALGLVEADGPTRPAMPYKTALEKATKRLSEIDQLRDSPEAAAEAAKEQQRLTVAGAWAHLQLESVAQRQATTQKEVGQYNRYLSHLGDCHLDELPYAFWSRYVLGLKAGKRLNADGQTFLQLPQSKRAAATVNGIVNLAAKLYTTAHTLGGLPGQEKSWNPPLQTKKKLVGTPNVRTKHIPLTKVAEVWRAADILCESWARDQLRLYLLTGLRFSLNADLQFSEVDSRGRRLAVSPHKKGTKRRKKDTPDNAPDILLPLSATALQIIDARREWAPDPNGPVWYATKAPGGKAAEAGAPRVAKHSDPRSNWGRISEHVLDGMLFLRHDLRRTFAQIGLESGADLVGVSLLMLHAPRTLAKLMDVPDITVQYMNTPLAQKRMRSAADAIETYIKGLLDGSIVPSDEEQDLPPELASAVGKVGQEDDD